MTTLRFWLPAHASARFRQTVLLPTPSFGPVNTTTLPGSLREVRTVGASEGLIRGSGMFLLDDFHGDEEEQGLLGLRHGRLGEEEADQRNAAEERDLGLGRVLRAGLESADDQSLAALDLDGGLDLARDDRRDLRV